ncbi:MAG TPA: glycosyltransferase family A protein [Actinocrinis sp.]|nr:glycosyltransferase family A protein [Actinocrinis sp.]
MGEGARVLSIVTPILDPRPDYLAQAYESLASQEMPSGWEWEWVVQEDGRTGGVARLLPPDPRVRVGTGRPHGGVGQTRNMALARSRGELVKAFDGDDVMGEGVLERDIRVLSDSGDGGDGGDGVQWATSRALDLLPDGSTVASEHDPEPGRLEPGSVADYWRSHGYRLPVHGVTLCMRRSLLVALGGWMGVPGSDDTGLLIAASVVSPGYFHDEVGLYYRKWPGQVTAQPAHTEPDEWHARMRLIEERGAALGRMWRKG